MAGTMIDVSRWTMGSWYYMYGVQQGSIIYWSMNPWDMMDSASPQPGSGVMVDMHGPRLGGFGYIWSPRYSSVSVPLWILFLVVIGWIVFREVRWRKKMRAKEKTP
jgi:hypothetical protein